MEDCENGGTTTVMDLPDDCLVFIFKQLSCGSDREVFGLTCRRWLEIQSRNRLSLQFNCSLTNSKVPLSGTPLKVDTYKLHRVLNRFQHLQSMSLSGCMELPDSSLMQLQHCGSSLRALNLDCCFEITDTGFSFVACSCPLLTTISLYRCKISDMGLEKLAKSCLALKEINISYCSFITDDGIRVLVQTCLQLRAIRMNNCKGITGVGFIGCSQNLACLEAESCKLMPEGISSIVSGRGLEYLNISALTWSIYGDGLAFIGAGFATRLRVLNLRLCRTMSEEAAAAIAKGCPSLVEWNLSLCHEVGFVGWEAIAYNCHKLEKLHANRCRNLCDNGLQVLRSGCKKLSVLHISGCPRISAVALELFRLARGNVMIKADDENFPIGPIFEFWW